MRRQAAAANAAMDRYAKGTDAAFSELYDLLAPRLLSYLCRQTQDRASAEDLLQQTMLQIHRQRGRFIQGAQVTPWAFAIARHYLIDRIRAEKRHKSSEAKLTAVEKDPQPPIDDVVSSMELATKVCEEFSRLPDKQRIVLEMMKLDGLSLSEVAQVLGTTINAIKLRIHRAYSTLQAAAVSDDAE